MRECGLGQRLPRSEDHRLVQGYGRYTDDFAFARQAYLSVVRSPHACAAIRSIRAERALRVDGVLAVLTGEDVLADGLGTFPSRVKRTTPEGRPNFEPPYRALAVEKVYHVGEAVVAVVAESLAAAQEAADLVEVDYEPLPAVTATRRAAEAGAPTVWPQAPDNICFLYELGEEAAVADAFSAAAHVSELDFTITRVSANPMEARNAIGSYDRGTGRYTLYAGMQAPHSVRTELAEQVLNVPEIMVRIVSPDCGGSFGMKEGVYPELVLVLWASKKVGRVVRWQSDRIEAFLSDHHARDNLSRVGLALDSYGRFLALRVRTIANLGAYLNVHGNHSPTNNLGGLAGTYMIPHIYASVRGVFSHTNPTSPYRGAGRPEASYAVERVIDHAAAETGIDRVELRRRNMIPPSAMPYRTGLVYTYDSGEFEKNMDLALELSDWQQFKGRRAEAAGRGKLRGIGLASVVEAAGGPSARSAEEYAEIRFDPSGNATLLTGTHSQGQGHETAFRQMAVELLGLSYDRIRVACGDTDEVPYGRGTFGSRSAVLIGMALGSVAQKLIAKGTVIASGLLETSADDIEFQDGRFAIVGTDRSVDIETVAKASFDLAKCPPGVEPGFAASAVIVPEAPTFPNSCHVCEVEIDPETGVVSVVGYWTVEDVGRVVNPALVEGQIQGGIAQGLGQALFEQIVYDDTSGQLLTGSFLDYCMPRAADVPRIEVQTNPVLTKTNPLGIKGAGEAGVVGALPAVMNAVVDALSPLGIRHFDMPATPERVWRAIGGAAERGVAQSGEGETLTF